MRQIIYIALAIAGIYIAFVGMKFTIGLMLSLISIAFIPVKFILFIAVLGFGGLIAYRYFKSSRRNKKFN